MIISKRGSRTSSRSQPFSHPHARSATVAGLPVVTGYVVKSQLTGISLDRASKAMPRNGDSPAAPHSFACACKSALREVPATPRPDAEDRQPVGACRSSARFGRATPASNRPSSALCGFLPRACERKSAMPARIRYSASVSRLSNRRTNATKPTPIAWHRQRSCTMSSRLSPRS